jgi:hypothetical protein
LFTFARSALVSASIALTMYRTLLQIYIIRNPALMLCVK